MLSLHVYRGPRRLITLAGRYQTESGREDSSIITIDGLVVRRHGIVVGVLVEFRHFLGFSGDLNRAFASVSGLSILLSTDSRPTNTTSSSDTRT